MNTNILETKEITRVYRNNGSEVHALRGINLAVEPGELVAVMGPSGCGKSTLLHILGGLDSPTSGEVFLDGMRIDKMNEGQRAVRAEIEFQKGEAALRARRPEAALAHFQAAVESYPDEGEYHACLGWALHLTAPDDPNVMKRAYGHVQKGRKLAPDRSKTYLLLGRLALVEERPDVASKMFSRAVQLDPDCLEALRELRLINMRRERSKSLVKRILRR